LKHVRIDLLREIGKTGARDLLNEIGPVDLTNCMDETRWLGWERNIAERALRAKGFEILDWWSQTFEEFPPYTPYVRMVRVKRNGQVRILFYC
jgi:hypothetical protein